MNKDNNNQVPSLSDFNQDLNPYLSKGFTGTTEFRTPKQVLSDNLAKGFIDQAEYDKAVATYDNLVKAKGEGSRGGHIIGHTKSGKPVYASGKMVDHKNFNEQDHKDAAELHKTKHKYHDDASYELEGSPSADRSSVKNNHDSLAAHHLKSANEHSLAAQLVSKTQHEASLSPDEKQILADQKKKQMDHHSKMETWHNKQAADIASSYKDMNNASQDERDEYDRHRSKALDHAKKRIDLG